jgi:hypothetical protein
LNKNVDVPSWDGVKVCDVTGSVPQFDSPTGHLRENVKLGKLALDPLYVNNKQDVITVFVSTHLLSLEEILICHASFC